MFVNEPYQGCFGHDIPIKITSLNIKENKFFYNVEWEKRTNELQPLENSFSSEEIRKIDK